MPVASAKACASEIEWPDEYLLGMATPFTRLAPSASTARAATSAESIPPDKPTTTLRKPFFST